MKNPLRRLLALSILAFSLGACETDKEEAAPEAFTGTWRLELVVGNVANQAPQAASELGYEEYYTLFEDYTFRKFRSTGAIVTGSYTLEERENKLYAVLDVEKQLGQDSGIPVGASCTPNRFYLYLDSGKLHDNNLACDIGYYIYKKAITTEK
jgi:hypothetical protein